MLFRCFGMHPEMSNCGSLRRRASTRFAVVRIERLEDRFLLTGRSAAAEPPTSGPQQPAASSSTDQKQGGSGTGSSGTSSPTGQSGSPAPSAATNECSLNQPCALDFAGFTTSLAAGPVTTSPLSTTSVPAGVLSPPPSISIPLPMPPGVPAGGIFKQIAARSTVANVSVLYLDPVAVDGSPVSLAPAASLGVTGAIHGGLPSSLSAQSAANTLGFGLLKSSVRTLSDSPPRLLPNETAARRQRPRAELPDITALSAVGVPRDPVSELVGDANPRPSINSMAEPTKVLASVAFPPVVNRIDLGEADAAETDLNEKRIPANLVIYSGISLIVGISAPGLTSMIRRGDAKAKSRLTVAARGRALGSAR